MICKKRKSDTKVWLDSIWGYWDPIEDLTISYNIPLDILHYLTIPNRKGYLTYRTDNLAQTAKPTLGREVGQQYKRYMHIQFMQIKQSSMFKIYFWTIGVSFSSAYHIDFFHNVAVDNFWTN